jgi:hypothetical protein
LVERVGVTIHWRGGFVSEHEVIRAVVGYCQKEEYATIRDRIVTCRKVGMSGLGRGQGQGGVGGARARQVVAGRLEPRGGDRRPQVPHPNQAGLGPCPTQPVPVALDRLDRRHQAVSAREAPRPFAYGFRRITRSNRARRGSADEAYEPKGGGTTVEVEGSEPEEPLARGGIGCEDAIGAGSERGVVPAWRPPSSRSKAAPSNPDACSESCVRVQP